MTGHSLYSYFTRYENCITTYRLSVTVLLSSVTCQRKSSAISSALLVFETRQYVSP